MSNLAYHKPVGVIGAGSFGTAIANLLAYNVDVLLFSRKEELVTKVNQTHQHFGINLSKRIKATTSLEEIAKACDILFPMVPSANFKAMMQQLGPHLRPFHIVIHGTKGLDFPDLDTIQSQGLDRSQVKTMSELIREESVVVRVGCLSGPNLAKEIMEGQPTATVIASHFKEVVEVGKHVLGSEHFHVFGTADLLGAELAGALKNIIAIGSGILRGKGLGKNIQAVLITRGLHEMINFGKMLGADSIAFLGTAGIGDLVATATSKNSRNFTFGYRLGQGESFETIQDSMSELAEGVRTLKVVHKLAQKYKLRVPITNALHRIVYEEFDIDKSLNYLMTYPYDVDVDFSI
ncbi:MAG: NAD(P)H-dependent glycerol-3-phosphate dehydrogenase [Bacteroidota bacterium]